MIRYVLAAAVTVGLLALAVPALDRGATVTTEREVDASVAAIDEAATALVEHEEPSPDGHPDPRRVVDVTLPRGSLTATAVDRFEIHPHDEYELTRIRYVLADGTTREATVDARIVGDGPDGSAPVELGPGVTGLTLSLGVDEDGTRVAVVRRVHV